MIHLTATTVAEQSVGSRNHKSVRPESRSDPKWPFIKGHLCLMSELGSPQEQLNRTGVTNLGLRMISFLYCLK